MAPAFEQHHVLARSIDRLEMLLRQRGWRKFSSEPWMRNTGISKCGPSDASRVLSISRYRRRGGTTLNPRSRSTSSRSQ